MLLAQSLSFGPYRLDGPSGPLWHHAAMVAVPPKALAVLWLLACQAGQVVSKATLLDTVWAETAVSEGTLTTCLSLLRHALGEDARQPRYIATVHRLGYRFVASVTPQGPPTSLAPPSAPPAGVSSPSAPPLVGRAAELAQLHAWFAQARQGGRQTVFVTGEAGMGKTTLVEAFLAEVAAAQTAAVGRGQCIDHAGAGEAYLPLLDALGRLGRGPAGTRLVACLRQYAPTWLAQLPAVAGEAERAAWPQRHGGTPQRMLRELAEALDAFTVEQPLVLVLEDLHWSDASTIAALTLLARRQDAARLLVLGTYRPVELLLRQHPLKASKQELQLHGHCAEVPVGYLPVAAVQAYLAQRGPAAAATAAWAAWVHRRTEGQPLFMVHVVEELARGGRLTAAPGAEEVEVPAGLTQLIALQLGQLDAEEQQVLEVASVVGAEFAEASVAAGLPLPLEAIAARCEALARRGQFLEDRGLVAWPDGTRSGRYGFRHTVYQEVLYGRLGSGRRMRCHQAIGLRLEAAYGAQVSQIAATLAEHFERGCDDSRAVRYRQQAAAQALERYAYQEAIGHLTRGLALLQTLPETCARARHELALQTALGPALLARHGAAALVVEQAYVRMWELCQHVGEPSQRSAALLGLGGCHIVRGRLQTARALLRHALRCAPGAPTTADHGQAHVMLGSIAFFLGEFATARAHLEQGLTLYAPPSYLRGSASRSFRLIRLAEVLWHLGYHDQAHQCRDEALGLTHAVAVPADAAATLIFAAMLHRYRREPQHTLVCAEHALALYHDQDPTSRLTPARGPRIGRSFGAFTAEDPTLRLTQARILRGWALVMQGQGETGLVQLHEGIMAYRTSGAILAVARYLVILAEVQGHLGDPAQGLQVLAEARAVLAASEERDQEAELYRLQGDLLVQCATWRPASHVMSRPSRQPSPQRDTAEACFRHALAIARQQGAKSLELRAAMSLSRLWQQQGKQAEARELLAPIYGWFTEGFDTADLQEAKTLLEELGG